MIANSSLPSRHSGSLFKQGDVVDGGGETAAVLWVPKL